MPVPTPVVPADAATIPSDADVLSACSFLTIELTDRGTWVGSPPSIRCFAPKLASGAHDARWLQATATELREALAPACTPPVYLAPAPDIVYQTVVESLHALRAAQLDAMLSSASPMTFDPTATGPRQCDRPVAVLTAAPPGTPAPSDQTLRDAPAIVITKTEILLGKVRVATVADATRGQGTLGALANALAAKPPGPVILLRADAQTPAHVVTRVVETAKQAGFDNILYAVKRP